jgi:hypothetical protein
MLVLAMGPTVAAQPSRVRDAKETSPIGRYRTGDQLAETPDPRLQAGAEAPAAAPRPRRREGDRGDDGHRRPRGGRPVLSYKAATRPPGVRESDLATVEARLTLVGGQLDDLKSRLATATKTANRAQATAQLARTGKPRTPNLSVCLYQLQREIDDLQAYLVYRTSPAQHRVTGACARLLVPRFAG